MAPSHAAGPPQLLAVALMLAATMTPAFAGGQEPAATSIRINHARRAAHVAQGGKLDPANTGAQIRVPSPRRVAIVVDSTNSAFYACNLVATPAHVPELDSMRTFLAALGPFVPAVWLAALPRAERADPVADAARNLKDSLRLLDSVVTARGGLQWTLRQTLEALENLRSESGASIGRTASILGDTLGSTCDREGCHLLIARILGAESAVARGKAALEALRGAGGWTDAHESLVDAARNALADQDKIMATAYGVEAIVHAAVNASDTIVCDTVEFPGDEGRDLTITVAPRQTPELGRLADRKSYELKVTVLPEWVLRPTLSVALLRVSQAVYPTYGTTSAPNSQVQVIESGSKDFRVTYGLTLGVTTRWTDWRDGAANLALWFPELTINPSDDVSAIGIGAALSYGPLKIGAGALWVKHDVLAGESVGQLLTDANLLRTRPAFGSAKFYVSVSVTGWQPFMRSGK